MLSEVESAHSKKWEVGKYRFKRARKNKRSCRRRELEGNNAYEKIRPKV